MLPSISEEYQRCDQEQVHSKKKITIKNKKAKKKKTHTQKHTVGGTFPKFNRKIVDRGKSIAMPHKYMTALCPGLV